MPPLSWRVTVARNELFPSGRRSTQKVGGSSSGLPGFDGFGCGSGTRGYSAETRLSPARSARVPVMAPIARDYWPAGPANSRESFFHLSVRPRRGVADEVEQLLAVAIGAEVVGDAAGFCDDGVVAMASWRWRRSASPNGSRKSAARRASLRSWRIFLMAARMRAALGFDLLAVDGDGVALHFGGDLAVGFGGDAGDLREAEVIIAELVELADEGVGASRVMPA